MKRQIPANITQHPDGFIAILTQGVAFEFTCDVEIDTCVTRLVEYAEQNPLWYGDRKKRSNLILNPIGKHGYEFAVDSFRLHSRRGRPVGIEGKIVGYNASSTTVTAHIHGRSSNKLLALLGIFWAIALIFTPLAVIPLIFVIAILAQNTGDCRHAPRTLYEYLTDEDRSKYVTLMEQIFGRE